MEIRVFRPEPQTEQICQLYVKCLSELKNESLIWHLNFKYTIPHLQKRHMHQNKGNNIYLLIPLVKQFLFTN